MKLYKLTTAGLGFYYVVAETPNDAENKLIELLEKADYGFLKNRKVKIIELLADEITTFPGDKPNFFTELDLIIFPNSCIYAK